MGSLNGDIMVIRNGRTTSQVSVYNYPEHLNPFYEDDQHKRLRFWKISKKDNEGRRNSFSIGNLKDMWAFKTFRMKKKSSTLGINKTSESPPVLRRDYVLDNGWNTFDHRLRASNTSSMNNDTFQRNATYRSSLQTLPTASDRIGLNRNDAYRSTIQVPRSSPRYQLQQKQQQQLQQTMGVSQNRRSSQSSMVSTNPFESDDEENEDINSIGMRSAVNGSTTTLTSRTPRKKRRAPAPPTPIQGRNNGSPLPIIRIEPSHDDTQDELRIKEDIDIANLTAEIESFVKTKSNDDVAVTSINEFQTEKEVEERKAEVDKETQETTDVIKDNSNNVFATEDIDTSSKEKTNVAEKVNGQVKIEMVTVITTSTNGKANSTEAAKKETNATKVSSETGAKSDESKEIKTNGAIPKKATDNSIDSSIDEQNMQQQTIPMVADLCIKETQAEESPQKPVPLKRQTKPEAEIGHIECIHVHVESPRATPRKEHPNGLLSFKTNDTVESTETITTKTPFVLTTPPTPRRNRQQREHGEPVVKETVKILETNTVNERINELNINEERINNKLEALVRPTLSPKPVMKEPNGKVYSFAEIHKPMRRSNQNGHLRKTSRDGSISPPFVPQDKIKQEDDKINNIVNFQTTNSVTGAKAEAVKPIQFKTVNNLKIVETINSNGSNGDVKPIEEGSAKEIKGNMVLGSNNSNCVSTVTDCKEVQRRDDESFLYRPKPANHMEWKRSTLAPLETNIPPEKRKSVKDIIESINRSQRLLNAAANKDFTALQVHNAAPGPKTIHQSSLNNNNNNLNANLTILYPSPIEPMPPSTKTEDLDTSVNAPSPSPSNCNNECTEELDNSEIFQKCKVKKEVYDYRETSPITSNLDWNPVPKPKRTKPAND